MNQILVTKKLYVTPELKKKKKFYKIHFIISILLIAVLGIAYVYAAYDRDRSEAVSQEVLSGIKMGDDTTVDDGVLVAYLDGRTNNEEEQAEQPRSPGDEEILQVVRSPHSSSRNPIT